MDSDLQRHEMILEKTHDSGAEEWYCPVCGRRFLMQWPPNYQKVIIEPGDNYATHSGGKGGVSMGTPRTSQSDKVLPDETELPIDKDGEAPSELDPPIKEDGVNPWLDWMDKVDFESLWTDDKE